MNSRQRRRRRKKEAKTEIPLKQDENLNVKPVERKLVPGHPHIVLQLFSYGGVMEGTVDSIIREFAATPNLLYSRISGDALISRSRCKAASNFIELKDERTGTTPDCLVMVDHDLEWSPGSVGRIARKAMETGTVVGGLYCKRARGKGFASRPVPGRFDIRLGEDKLIEATYIATGFMAIPRKVLTDILDAKMDDVKYCSDGAQKYHTFFHPIVTAHTMIEGYDEYLSEDWSFCLRVQRVRDKLWLDVMPILGHTGDYIYRLHDGEAWIDEAPPDLLRSLYLGHKAKVTAGGEAVREQGGPDGNPEVGTGDKGGAS